MRNNTGPDIRTCQECKKQVERSEMDWTRDCHGIPFRLVCGTCFRKIMHSGKRYDGCYYTEADERIEPEY